jgi:hypothetical protein
MPGVNRIGSYNGIENLKFITTFDDLKSKWRLKNIFMRCLL